MTDSKMTPERVVAGLLAARDAEWRRKAQASARCVNHPDLPSRVNLDGDNLCQECADAWVRAEGQWQAEQERKAP